MPKRPGSRASRRDFQVTGHRGNGSGPQENTVASFKAALRAGADRLETDIQLVDDELVLAHPPRQPRATLRQLLDLTDTPLVLHLKRRHFNPWHDRQVADRLAPMITQRPDVTVSSFWPGTLTYLNRHHPGIRTAFATFWPGYDLFFSRRLGVAEYHGWWGAFSRRTVAHARRRGLKLVAFVPNSPTEIARLHRLGLDGVITDGVAEARRTIRPARTRSARGTRRSAVR